MKLNASVVGGVILLALCLLPMAAVMAWDWGWRSLLFWLCLVVVAHVCGMAALGSWNPWRTIRRSFKGTDQDKVVCTNDQQYDLLGHLENVLGHHGMYMKNIDGPGVTVEGTFYGPDDLRALADTWQAYLRKQ